MPEKKYEHLVGNFVHFPRVIERGTQPREIEDAKVFVSHVDGRNVKATIVTGYKDYHYEWEIPEGVEPKVLDPAKLSPAHRELLQRERKLLNHDQLVALSERISHEGGLLGWMKEHGIELSKKDESMLKHLSLLSDETVLNALKKAKEKGLVDRYWETKL
jgi:hypothetical protein